MELFKRLTKTGLLFGSLKKLGRSPPAKPSATTLKVYRAVIGDKVALIDRLPSKYRQEVQEAVWGAVVNGYDAAGLARDLHDRFGIVPERARLLAATQCKLARSVIENAQHIENGLTEAVWVFDRHRCGVASHQALHGRRYSLAHGAESDGKRVWPSGEPLCSCASAVDSGAEKDDAA